jgi:hypothetical protein
MCFSSTATRDGGAVAGSLWASESLYAYEKLVS